MRYFMVLLEKELTRVAVFQGKEIRKIFFKGEWWFSVTDVIQILTESDDARDYWYRMKKREKDSAKIDLSRLCRKLKIVAEDERLRLTECSNLVGIFRIVQSIPSPKVEPFKQWLAKLGKERLDELENPEIGVQRAREIYLKKGYPEEWIEKRVQGIGIRQKLTDEWDERGAETSLDYALLTDEIMKGSFGLKTSEYKEHKGLAKENLRDHMSDVELVVTMLAEVTTTKITKERDSQGMPELKKDAQDGGAVAGRARLDIESQTGTKVITQENYLSIQKKRQKKYRDRIGSKKTIQSHLNCLQFVDS